QQHCCGNKNPLSHCGNPTQPECLIVFLLQASESSSTAVSVSMGCTARGGWGATLPRIVANVWKLFVVRQSAAGNFKDLVVKLTIRPRTQERKGVRVSD